MSSPNTSVKAAPLYTSREKSSSPPSIATFEFIRKKPPPPQPSSPVEPYEVTPGLWSTDATARVFGHLDTDDKRAILRNQSAGANINQKAKWEPAPTKDSPGACRKARFVDREQYICNTIRDASEPLIQSRQKRRDEKGNKAGSNLTWAARREMRTVSRDDQLVERGANPRTGLVSPFVVSDNSEERLGGDYIAVGRIKSAAPSPGRRTRSGKWKQDSLGWSLVESPLSSPIAQSMSDRMSRAVSMDVGDRLLVEMPSADNPNPRNMTHEQIREQQEGIARAYKHGGSVAMLDPDALPSPRQWTPKEPSKPPTKLHKIQRKEVGSGVVCKSNSSNTVIKYVNDRARSLPTPRKNTTQRQEVQIIAPSNTPKGSSFESSPNISSAIREPDPFLGRGSQRACSQTAKAQSPSHVNTGKAPQSRQKQSESSPSSTLSDLRPSSQILSQYLPRLPFLHASHFGNLETYSYRRPTQLLPAEPLGQQIRAVKDVCTTTFTTTSTKGPLRNQRPKMQRHRNDIMPRVDSLPSQYQKPLDGYHQAKEAIGPTEKPNSAKDLAKTRDQRKTQMPAEYLRLPECKKWSRNFASPTHMTQGVNHEGANVGLERIQRSESGDGCTPIYGHLDEDSRAVPGGRLRYVTNNKVEATIPAGSTIGGDSRAWFTLRAEVGEEGKLPDVPAWMQEETLARRRSVSRKATEAQVKAHGIIWHVIRTLHHASLALTTLRTANATSRDRFEAIKVLALAAIYLLALLKLLMVLREVLVFVSKVLYWIWHPMQTILLIIGWCLIGS